MLSTKKKLNYKFIYQKFQNSISSNTVVFAFMSCRYAKKGCLFTWKPFENTQMACGCLTGVYVEYLNKNSLRFPDTGKMLASAVKSV